jgi:hypothetical protein
MTNALETSVLLEAVCDSIRAHGIEEPRRKGREKRQKVLSEDRVNQKVP